MIAVKAMELRDNFKEYCDKVTSGETIFVTRKPNENVVILSEKEYNEMLKAKRNAEYLEKIDLSMQQVRDGRVVAKTIEELEEMEK